MLVIEDAAKTCKRNELVRAVGEKATGVVRGSNPPRPAQIERSVGVGPEQEFGISRRWRIFRGNPRLLPEIVLVLEAIL